MVVSIKDTSGLIYTFSTRGMLLYNINIPGVLLDIAHDTVLKNYKESDVQAPSDVYYALSTLVEYPLEDCHKEPSDEHNS